MVRLCITAFLRLEELIRREALGNCVITNNLRFTVVINEELLYL